MGTWGMQSFENDKCWDAIVAQNIHQVTSAETNLSLDLMLKKIKPNDAYFTENQEIFVGICIWGLKQANTIKPEYLRIALGFIASISSQPDYFAAYLTEEEKQERQTVLETEAATLKNALQHSASPSA